MKKFAVLLVVPVIGLMAACGTTATEPINPGASVGGTAITPGKQLNELSWEEYVAHVQDKSRCPVLTDDGYVPCETEATLVPKEGS